MEVHNIIWFSFLFLVIFCDIVNCQIIGEDYYSHEYIPNTHGSYGYGAEHSEEVYHHYRTPYQQTHTTYRQVPQTHYYQHQEPYHYPNYRGHRHIASLFQPSPVEQPQHDIIPHESFPQGQRYTRGEPSPFFIPQARALQVDNPLKQMIEPMKKQMEDSMQNMNEMGKKMTETAEKPAAEFGKQMQGMIDEAAEASTDFPFIPSSSATPKKEGEEVKKDESGSEDKKGGKDDKKGVPTTDSIPDPMKAMQEAGSTFMEKIPKPPNPMKMMAGLTGLDRRIRDETTEVFDEDSSLFPRPRAERLEWGHPDYVDIQNRRADYFDYYYDNLY